jgi:hypothetical protein
MYLTDPHQGGRATRLQLQGVTWGRLVDVHDVDERGVPSPQPLLRDLVVDETVLTDATAYRLETNPITARNRLVIQRQSGVEDPGDDFTTYLRRATTTLPPILPRGADSTSTIPFSSVPRNACLVVQFDDLLRDDASARRTLDRSVVLQTGYPPSIPAAPRVFFDPNHGGLAGGSFHSTRVLLDFTVSEAELVDVPVPLALSTIGLPPSEPRIPDANVLLRIPTQVHAASGQFAVLENLAGNALAPTDNGPIDVGVATQDIVRAMRSGNLDDANNGFLLDINAPRVVATWSVVVEGAAEDPEGEPGFDFLVGLHYQTPCHERPQRGDIIAVGEEFLEVRVRGFEPDLSGRVSGVRVRSVSARPLPATALFGSALYRTPFREESRVQRGCWATVSPQPLSPPASSVSPFARVSFRFSEPMDPNSFQATDSFQIVRGPGDAEVTASSLVVARIVPHPDLQEFTSVPSLPFAHQGNGAFYGIRLVSDAKGKPTRGVTDLAGNPLQATVPPIEFVVDQDAPQFTNSGISQRFNEVEELPNLSGADLRGNVFRNLSRGELEPRAVMHATWPIDRTNPVPSLMIPFPIGIQTPLSPLGSKLQTVWRYADAGWSVRDESKYDLDVTGISWSPVGFPLADFYPQFQIRLGHSRFLPDEIRANLGVSRFPRSGLGGSAQPFADNYLGNSLGKIVHARNLGYRLNPQDIYIAHTGTFLMPWPMNRVGGPFRTFTWRDTSIGLKAGFNGAGIPLSVEAEPPLELEENRGSVAQPGQVPTFGLPLLMEFRCYPTSSGLGLNPLEISLAINTSAQPNFRAFSTGGINTAGRRVAKNPDLQVFPTGGFNPRSRPPGRPTANQADNTFYIGALDTVIRVNRGYSCWIDTGYANPTFEPPIVFPARSEQPQGTDVRIDFRGATGFAPGVRKFDANFMDAYGNLSVQSTTFHKGRSSWFRNIRKMNGARFLQMRYTMINNIQSGVSPRISSISIAFSK